MKKDKEIKDFVISFKCKFCNGANCSDAIFHNIELVKSFLFGRKVALLKQDLIKEISEEINKKMEDYRGGDGNAVHFVCVGLKQAINIIKKRPFFEGGDKK